MLNIHKNINIYIYLQRKESFSNDEWDYVKQAFSWKQLEKYSQDIYFKNVFESVRELNNVVGNNGSRSNWKETHTEAHLIWNHSPAALAAVRNPDRGG